MLFTDLFIAGFLAHNVADWFLQTEWMALNKGNIHSPAGYIHAAIHGLIMSLVWPWWAAVVVAAWHWFIDLRWPLDHWRRLMRQTNDPKNPFYLHVLLWQDQIAHWLVIAVMAWKMSV